MNIVAIDPSLNCTALVVNDKRFAFVNETICHTKSGKLTKWFELASSLISYFPIAYNFSDGYSESEMDKLDIFDETTSLIRDIILENIKPQAEVQIYIEGYSYSSAAGPLIDLVAFGTLVRKKVKEITPYITIVSPTQLKVMAAKLTYPPIAKGKKVVKYEYRNNEGLAGGSFRKSDMYKALIENDSLKNDWVEFLRIHQEEVLNYKSVVKPIEDINDATILFEYHRVR